MTYKKHLFWLNFSPKYSTSVLTLQEEVHIPYLQEI